MNLLGFITLICKGPFSVNSTPCLFVGMDDVLPNYSPYIPRIMKVGLYFGVDWLTDWLTDRLTDTLTDQLIDWLIDWLTNGLTDWVTAWLIS